MSTPYALDSVGVPLGDEGKRLSHLFGMPYLILGESICIDPGLLLVLALFAPLEVAFLETPIDTDGHVVRNLKGRDTALADEARTQVYCKLDSHQWRCRRPP